MVLSLVRTHADPPDGRAVCPMCHTRAALTQSAVDAGGDWRCVRCGQQWDGVRLAAVADYAAWVIEHNRLARPSTNDTHAVARPDDPLRERLDGTP
jgi:ribosomal protein L37AE/L43A